MAKPKNDVLNPGKIVTLYNLEQKFTISNDSVTPLPKNHNIFFSHTSEPPLPVNHNIFFSQPTELARVYSSIDGSDRNEFAEWFVFIESMRCNFNSDFDPSIEAINAFIGNQKIGWTEVIGEFMDAIKEYFDQREECPFTSDISSESAKRFLFLVPVFASHKPRVYIDSSNGCFNVDLPTRDKGILSTHISENGQVHYSLVSISNKIYKISGTAKFRDARDYIKFNKVLQML